MLKKFLADEAGFVVSSELVLIATMLVLGLLVGLNTLRNSITSELDDVADAIGNISQDYSYAGITGHSASVSGTVFDDLQDFCEEDPAQTSGTFQLCTATVDGVVEG
jgi:Flp pilus assembly pilin Flp